MGIVAKHLGRNVQPVPEQPVAMAERLEPVWQALEQHNVAALYGMGGIGKTTLANAVFNQLQRDYVNCCCYVEIGPMSMDAPVRAPLIEVKQRQMLKDLCGLTASARGVKQNMTMLQERLRNAQVLLVLDDVWSRDQLECLLVETSPGSRVLVTSRNRGLLQEHLPRLCNGRYALVQVDLLSQSDSRRMLNLHAFGRPEAISHLATEAEEVADTCSCLPITLRVTGSFLAQHQSAQMWQGVCYRLRQAQPVNGQLNDDDIFASLRVSYTYLHPTMQTMLMDIACVLLGQPESAVSFAWGSDGLLGLENLKNLSLITVNGMGTLVMHDQVRDMLQSHASNHSNDKHASMYAWGAYASEVLRQPLHLMKVSNLRVSLTLPRYTVHEQECGILVSCACSWPNKCQVKSHRLDLC